SDLGRQQAHQEVGQQRRHHVVQRGQAAKYTNELQHADHQQNTEEEQQGLEFDGADVFEDRVIDDLLLHLVRQQEHDRQARQERQGRGNIEQQAEQDDRKSTRLNSSHVKISY